ncbi:hypothetical protein C2S51_031892 [Perilla frutescens var. frutescens]|nr:hypothetical protein C2S51_031892 [Perilla frutescens var. frutescens]
MKKMKSNVNEDKSNRFLVTVNVFGSAGAIRFVVKGDADAAAVTQTALKMYAREGRLPILGSDVDTFFLYPTDAGFQALNPWEKIGSRGARNFVLSKKESKPHMTEAGSEAINRKARGWRAWLHKSLSLKILSHSN